MSLSINKMDELLGKEINPRLKNILEIFLRAANDWPDECLTFESYISQIENCIGPVSQKSDLDKMSFPRFSAWQAESCAELMAVYQFYDSKISLKEILEDLRLELNSD